MMRKLFFIISVIYCISINAQITYEGPAEGSVNSGLTLNTNNFSFNNKYYQNENIVIQPEAESSYQELKFVDSSHVKRLFYFLRPNTNNILDSVSIFQSFSGIPQTNYNPPDDYIAVGPNHLMMVVNNFFRIYDKEGNILKTINAADWYSNLVANANPVDPKVLYDNFNDRWIMIWLYIDHVHFRSYYLISVSDDVDPDGIWFNWALPSNVNGNVPSNNWADYEGVGFDDKAIYLTSNQFTFSSLYEYVKIRIIDKSYVYINSDPGMVAWKDIWNITVPGNSNSASYLRPVRMKSYSDKYYLFYLPNGGGNFCAVYKLLDPVNNPELTAQAYPISSFAIAPDAKQLGGEETIEGGGSALRNESVYKNGMLYAIHSVRNPDNTALSCLHYLAVDPLKGLVKTDVAIGDEEHFFFYPAIDIDGNNNIIISYSRSSVNEYAGGFFTIIPGQSGVPLSSMVLKRGNGYYYKDNGNGRNRWGDYNGAWLDPKDSLKLWVCSEYVEALNTWGTWVGGVKYDHIIPVELTSFNAIIENDNVILSWEVASETNNYGFEIYRGTSINLLNKIGFVEGKGTTAQKQKYSFSDKNIENGTYFYCIKQIDFNGKENYLVQTSVDVNGRPTKFYLSQNFPDPFNPTTKISYQIAKANYVELCVYDLLGREVAILAKGYRKTGNYTVIFNGSNLSSGVYIYKLKSGDFISVKKMLLIK
jgi:Secretion system C-terminal sorting domain